MFAGIERRQTRAQRTKVKQRHSCGNGSKAACPKPPFRSAMPSHDRKDSKHEVMLPGARGTIGVPGSWAEVTERSIRIIAAAEDGPLCRTTSEHGHGCRSLIRDRSWCRKRSRL